MSVSVADPVLDDPGELIRFWVWHRYHYSVQRFARADLARALGIKPGTVSAWLARHGIPTRFWNPIARYFERESCRQIEDEAKALWGDAANRRKYIPLYRMHSRSTGAPHQSVRATPLIRGR